MNIDLITLCDGAIGPLEKFSIFGAFVHFYTKAVPFVASFSLALRVRLEAGEPDHHSFEINLIGKTDVLRRSIVRFRCESDDQLLRVQNLAVEFSDVNFPDFGQYACVVMEGNQKRSMLEFSVVRC